MGTAQMGVKPVISEILVKNRVMLIAIPLVVIGLLEFV